MLRNAHQLNDLALKLETREDGPRLSCDSGKASPTPPTFSPLSFRGYLKSEFFFLFFLTIWPKPGFGTSLDNFPMGSRGLRCCCPAGPLGNMWLKAQHLAVSSPCQAWSPYIAFSRPLAFEFLAESKCSKCIKRCTFFKTILWSPPS